ncbi:MAG: alpha/beta hydrolase [Parachlamydiaceae bacterium]
MSNSLHIHPDSSKGYFSRIHQGFNPNNSSFSKGKEKADSSDSEAEEVKESESSPVYYPYPDDSDSDTEDNFENPLYGSSSTEFLHPIFGSGSCWVDTSSTSKVEGKSFCSSTPKQRMFMISDRLGFDHDREFSRRTLIEEHFLPVEEMNLINPTKRRFFTKEDANIFSGRKVVIIIHGFTVTFTDALIMVGNTARKVKSSYDTIIGYTYPAYDNITKYPKAKKNGVWAAEKRLSRILRFISEEKPKGIDIIAHSLGTIVAMHALNQSISPRINHLFLLGGAVKEKSFFKKASPLEKALTNAKTIYALYSCKDKVLPWLSLYLSPRPAGRPGKEIKNAVFAENVCLVNASLVIQGHSCYFERKEVFKFFKLVAQETIFKGNTFWLELHGLKSSSGVEGCSFGLTEAVKDGMSNRKKYLKFKLKWW